MKDFINKEPFLIAEISANHNGSLAHAKKIDKHGKNAWS